MEMEDDSEESFLLPDKNHTEQSDDHHDSVIGDAPGFPFQFDAAEFDRFISHHPGLYPLRHRFRKRAERFGVIGLLATSALDALAWTPAFVLLLIYSVVLAIDFRSTGQQATVGEDSSEWVPDQPAYPQPVDAQFRRIEIVYVGLVVFLIAMARRFYLEWRGEPSPDTRKGVNPAVFEASFERLIKDYCGYKGYHDAWKILLTPAHAYHVEQSVAVLSQIRDHYSNKSDYAATGALISVLHRTVPKAVVPAQLASEAHQQRVILHLADGFKKYLGYRYQDGAVERLLPLLDGILEVDINAIWQNSQDPEALLFQYGATLNIFMGYAGIHDSEALMNRVNQTNCQVFARLTSIKQVRLMSLLTCPPDENRVILWTMLFLNRHIESQRVSLRRIGVYKIVDDASSAASLNGLLKKFIDVFADKCQSIPDRILAYQLDIITGLQNPEFNQRLMELFKRRLTLAAKLIVTLMRYALNPQEELDNWSPLFKAQSIFNGLTQQNSVSIQDEILQLKDGKECFRALITGQLGIERDQLYQQIDSEENKSKKVALLLSNIQPLYEGFTHRAHQSLTQVFIKQILRESNWQTLCQYLRDNMAGQLEAVQLHVLAILWSVLAQNKHLDKITHCYQSLTVDFMAAISHFSDLMARRILLQANDAVAIVVQALLTGAGNAGEIAWVQAFPRHLLTRIQWFVTNDNVHNAADELLPLMRGMLLTRDDEPYIKELVKLLDSQSVEHATGVLYLALLMGCLLFNPKALSAMIDTITEHYHSEKEAVDEFNEAFARLGLEIKLPSIDLRIGLSYLEQILKELIASVGEEASTQRRKMQKQIENGEGNLTELRIQYQALQARYYQALQNLSDSLIKAPGYIQRALRFSDHLSTIELHLLFDCLMQLHDHYQWVDEGIKGLLAQVMSLLASHLNENELRNTVAMTLRQGLKTRWRLSLEEARAINERVYVKFFTEMQAHQMSEDVVSKYVSLLALGHIEKYKTMTRLSRTPLNIYQQNITRSRNHQEETWQAMRELLHIVGIGIHTVFDFTRPQPIMLYMDSSQKRMCYRLIMRQNRIEREHNQDYSRGNYAAHP